LIFLKKVTAFTNDQVYLSNERFGITHQHLLIMIHRENDNADKEDEITSQVVCPYAWLTSA